MKKFLEFINKEFFITDNIKFSIVTILLVTTIFITTYLFLKVVKKIATKKLDEERKLKFKSVFTFLNYFVYDLNYQNRKNIHSQNRQQLQKYFHPQQNIDDNKKISELQGSITVERYYQAWFQRNPNLKQVSLVKELAIRTPFDLLNININLRIESPEFESKRTDLEGDMYISKTFYDALELTKDGYKLICKFVNNEHLEESRTAQNIKNFMSENMQSTQVLLDYGELSIDKFTDKYAIDCDLSDLIILHEKNPIAELKSSQKSHDVRFERLKDNDQNNDFTI